MQTVSRLIEQFTPTHYNLSLTLEREQRTFSGIVTIEGTSTGNDIMLHAKGLSIAAVTVDGRRATYIEEENDQLRISGEFNTGEHIVTVTFSGTISDPMHGLYPCYFEHDGIQKELLATQFESHHAREVFPCVDEPEAKSTFDVTLTTEAGVTVLGNMPVKRQNEENGKLVTSFETTPRMSSYLLAWVVGDLHKKTASTKDGVEVNVWATPAQPAAGLDFALETAVKTIEFFEDYFDTPYPLPKSDHVALPDFSSGAMENWGLITYREVALLADPATTGISTKRYVAKVVAHELSHQWFGNLVTMKWWNNLWLNESFANMMEYVAVDALYPEWDIWLEFSAQESIMALRRDAIDGVQSVQVEVNHPDEINSLFDGAIVYAKGGRLLRMLQHYIGQEAFQAGLKSYFAKYAYKNTEGDDLWHELGTASGKDIISLMNAWISQPGYPVVTVKEDGLSQEQFFIGPHEPSTCLWPIPLNGTSDDLPALLEIASIDASVSPLERLNIGDTAHFITQYAPVFIDSILAKLRNNELTPVDRLQFLHEQTLLVRGGYKPSAELLPLLAAYKDETNDDVWDIISLALGELKKFVEDDEASEKALRTLAGRLAEQQFERLGWETKANEPETDTKLRSTIIGMMAYSERDDIIQKARQLYDSSELQNLDPELRPLILSVVVRHFDDARITEPLLETYKTTQNSELQNDICAGLTSTKNTAFISQLLDAMKNSKIIRSQDVFRWFVYLIRNRYGRDLAWQWVQDNWEWVEQTFGGDKSYDDFPRYAASGLMNRRQLEEYKSFFTPKMSIPALSRVIALGIVEIEGRVELIERDGAAVRSALIEL